MIRSNAEALANAEGAEAQWMEAANRLCEIAFQAGFRLGITPPELHQNPETRGWEWRWRHVILGPGEQPPSAGRWLIYENRAGVAVGRSAR